MYVQLRIIVRDVYDRLLLTMMQKNLCVVSEDVVIWLVCVHTHWHGERERGKYMYTTLGGEYV